MTAVPTSVRAGLRLWPALPPAGVEDLQGVLAASFLRPLTTVAPRGLGLVGLPRWHGKRFEGAAGVNLVRPRDGGPLEARLPMTLGVAASWSDDLPAAVVSYAPDAPRPWRWVRDEVRRLDADTFLGMTFVALPGGRHTPGTPFLLTRGA